MLARPGLISISSLSPSSYTSSNYEEEILITRRKVFGLLKDTPQKLFPEELAPNRLSQNQLLDTVMSVFVLDG